jgi:hypothetical protein
MDISFRLQSIIDPSSQPSYICRSPVAEDCQTKVNPAQHVLPTAAQLYYQGAADRIYRI